MAGSRAVSPEIKGNGPVQLAVESLASVTVSPHAAQPACRAGRLRRIVDLGKSRVTGSSSSSRAERIETEVMGLIRQPCSSAGYSAIGWGWLSIDDASAVGPFAQSASAPWRCSETAKAQVDPGPATRIRT